MHNIYIQELLFSQHEVRRYTGQRLGPRNQPQKPGYSWDRIKDYLPSQAMQIRCNLVGCLSIFSPTFHIGQNGGVFLSDPKGNWKNFDYKNNEKLTIEGINNHIHLNVFARNRVAQFHIGILMIKLWGMILLQTYGKPCHFYLHGNRALVFCIYSNIDPDGIRQLNDNIANDVKLLKMSYKKFSETYLPKLYI